MYRAEALFKEALERQRAGDLTAAESLYRSALAADPELLPARVNLAIVLRSLTRHADALDVLGGPNSERAEPAPIHNERALTLLGLHRYEEAEAALRDALRTDRDAADAHFNLGRLLLSQGRHREAVSCFEEAVRRDPRDGKLHDGLGAALLALGDIDGATRSLLRSIEINPRFAPAWCHLGDVDRARGSFSSAQIAYGCALTLEPEHAMALWGQALAWLAAGDFRQGWPAYDRRLECGIVRLPPVRAKPWGDEPIAGKRVLVLGEQGIGDEIMFARFALSLAQAGARPVLTCEPRLAPLFRRSLDGVEIEGLRGLAGEGAVDADLSVPVGSLPARFWGDGASAMFKAAYLRPDPARLELWRGRLAALGPGLKVGISWRGGKDALVRTRRSTGIEAWQGLLATKGAVFVNLQYGDCKSDLARLKADTGLEIADWADSDPLADLDDFAAKVAALDLVVSVDNSTIHMAGALGRPVFALLPAPADWRWMTERSDTPWYPSVRLFRQSAPGQWGTLFERATAALKPLASGAAPSVSIRTSEPPAATRAPSGEGRRIAFLNDTSDWYHFGCTGTSGALKEGMAELGYDVRPVPITRLARCAPAPDRIADFDDAAFFERFRAANPDIVEAIEAAQVVVMNGEGSLHGTSPFARTLLYIAYVAATRLGRAVQIVNHSVYPENAARISDTVANALYKKVYEALSFIAVREPLSGEILRALGLAPTQAFDCLPLYVARHYRPRRDGRRSGVVVAGSVAWRESAMPALVGLLGLARDRREPVSVLVGAKANPARDDAAFIAALRAVQPTGWALIEAQSIESWLDTIAGARLLVSGRFHYTIAALCLETPFIALDSNTPKIQAMLGMTGQAPPLPYASPTLLDDLIARAAELLSSGAAPLSRDGIGHLERLARLNFGGLRAEQSDLIAAP